MYIGKITHCCLCHVFNLSLLEKICTVDGYGYDYAGCYLPDYTYGNSITASDMTLNKCAELCQRFFGEFNFWG